MAAWVVDRSFFGPDQLLRLRLAGGQVVRSRCVGLDRWEEGEEVRAWIEGPVHALAAEAVPTTPPEPSLGAGARLLLTEPDRGHPPRPVAPAPGRARPTEAATGSAARRRGPTHDAAAALVVGGCVLVAVATLPLPAALGYDPWAWMVWGREVGRLSLDTTGGPSWKPLPVLGTTVVAPAGDLAPTLWLVVARTAGLLALVGAARVGTRLAGPWAGGLAAGLLLLTPDAEARYLRLVAEGHSAPITAALVLWAWDRHLAGHHRTALVLGALLGLDRPEAWPFLGLYMAWLWWRQPGARPLVVGVAVALPVLWFGADWWGSGQALHGAEVAQVDAQDTDRLPTGLRRAAESVPLVVWAAARRRRGPRGARPRPCGAGRLGRRPGLAGHRGGHGRGLRLRSHRALPPAGRRRAVRAGGGGGGARGAGRARRRLAHRGHRRRRSWSAWPAWPGGRRAWRSSGATWPPGPRWRTTSTGPSTPRAAAPPWPTGCGRVVTDDPSIPRVAVAWKLDLPLHEVHGVRSPVAGPATAVVRTDGRIGRAYASGPPGVVERGEPAAGRSTPSAARRAPEQVGPDRRRRVEWARPDHEHDRAPAAGPA